MMLIIPRNDGHKNAMAAAVQKHTSHHFTITSAFAVIILHQGDQFATWIVGRR